MASRLADLSSRIATRIASRIRQRDTIGSILIVGLIVVIAPSVALLIRENAVARSEQRLENQSLEIEYGSAGDKLTSPAADAAYPARARVADALYIARQAQLSKSPSDQKAGLDHALQELNIAQAERPYWGEAKTVAGFVHALRDGEDAAITRQTLAQSYADAPYLRYAAAWRVQYGLRHWLEFSSVTQAQIIDEAVWLTRIDNRSREQIFALARESAAYQPFMLRSLAARANDVDFQTDQRPTP